jgi:TatD DNase family protein
MLTDTHAHLDYPDFKDDFSGVLQRAQEAGVSRLISIGTNLESSAAAVELARLHPQVWATVGIHPGEAQDAPADTIARLRQLAQSGKVVAIGEIGLDYHRLPAPEKVAVYKEKQAQVFRAQLELAADLGLNAVIHQRDSWDDCWNLLSPFNGRVRGVYHCFGGSIAEAKQVLAGGHLVSFTGIVTFKNAKLLHETVGLVPKGSFMVETDCPYLAPVPHRGKRCEPAFTRLVAERVAELRGTSLKTVADETSATVESFFRISA